jgi:hypothetical protein
MLPTICRVSRAIMIVSLSALTAHMFADAARTAIARITHLPYRIYLGIDFKARRNLYEVRMVIVHASDSLRARIDAAQKWRRQKQTRAYDQVQHVKKMVNDDSANRVTVRNYLQPAALTLRCVRTSTGALAFVSDRLMRLTETVSHVALSPLAATNAYLHELDNHAKQVRVCSCLGQDARLMFSHL